MDDMGARIRAARDASGLTRVELAREIERDHTTIYAWERGKREPRFSDVLKLAEVLGVDVSRFIDAHVSQAPQEAHPSSNGKPARRKRARRAS